MFNRRTLLGAAASTALVGPVKAGAMPELSPTGCCLVIPSPGTYLFHEHQIYRSNGGGDAEFTLTYSIARWVRDLKIVFPKPDEDQHPLSGGVILLPEAEVRHGSILESIGLDSWQAVNGVGIYTPLEDVERALGVST